MLQCGIKFKVKVPLPYRRHIKQEDLKATDSKEQYGWCRTRNKELPLEEGTAMQSIYQNMDLGGRRSGQDRRISADPNYRGIERRVSGERRKGTRQRKNPRFLVKEGSFAAIDSNYGVIGAIKNINKSGAAFQYIANEKQLAGPLTMDIFHNSREFYLKNLPFTAIADVYVNNTTAFSTAVLRRCSGKFDALTESQTSQLDFFIQNYTIGNA